MARDFRMIPTYAGLNWGMDVFREFKAGVIRDMTVRAYCSAIAAQQYQDGTGDPELPEHEQRKRASALWMRAEKQGMVIG